MRDLVVVGAGPAGLAAAVYGASEGLDVLVIESNARADKREQVQRSKTTLVSLLAFQDRTAGNAYAQAQKFGAQLLIARDAKGLACDRRPYALKFDGDEKIPAQVVIATGCSISQASNRESIEV